MPYAVRGAPGYCRGQISAYALFLFARVSVIPPPAQIPTRDKYGTQTHAKSDMLGAAESAAPLFFKSLGPARGRTTAPRRRAASARGRHAGPPPPRTPATRQTQTRGRGGTLSPSEYRGAAEEAARRSGAAEGSTERSKPQLKQRGATTGGCRAVRFDRGAEGGGERSDIRPPPSGTRPSGNRARPERHLGGDYDPP